MALVSAGWEPPSGKLAATPGRIWGGRFGVPFWMRAAPGRRSFGCTPAWTKSSYRPAVKPIAAKGFVARNGGSGSRRPIAWDGSKQLRSRRAGPEAHGQRSTTKLVARACGTYIRNFLAINKIPSPSPLRGLEGMTEVLKWQKSAKSPGVIRRAVEALAEGQLVAFPT